MDLFSNSFKHPIRRKLSHITWGAIFIAFGIWGLLSPSQPIMYQLPIPREGFYIVLLFGISDFMYGILAKPLKDTSEDILICPACRTSAYTKDTTQGHCPKCGGEMEPIEGFYERHPEEKDQ